MNNKPLEKKYFSNSTHHILAELERIDMLIRNYVTRSRQLQKVDSQFQGLYISDQEIDELLGRSAGLPRWANAPVPLGLDEVRAHHDQLATNIVQCKIESKKRGVNLHLENLVHLYDLGAFEVNILLVCLAPEFDLRYERLYAYLQDDVTKKRPSVDLVLNLLSPTFEDKLSVRHHFTPCGLLFESMILHQFDDPAHFQPTLLSKFLKIDDRIVNYLFGSNEVDFRLLLYTSKTRPTCRMKDLYLPAEMKRRVTRLVQKWEVSSQGLIFYFQGSYGVGKQSTAEAICHGFEMELLNIDVNRVLKAENLGFETAVHLIAREARLNKTALYIKGFDALLADDNQRLLEVLLHCLQKQMILIFLAGEKT